jgi:hypothetical protein
MWSLLTLVLIVLVLVLVLLSRREPEPYVPFQPYSEPPILIENILSPEECECVKSQPNCPSLNKLRKAAAQLSSKPLENVEPPLILEDNNTDGRRAHCSVNDTCSEFRDLGGERIGCFVVYLNDDFDGGELEFQAYGGEKIKPSAGSGVFFRPLLTNRDVYVGTPVSNGKKYTCVIFVREQNADKIEVE